MRHLFSITAISLFTHLFLSPSYAKVSQEEADKLGTILTPMGAIKEGNETGTIPPYTGTMLGAPEWVDYKGTGTHLPNPYPDEKPLFTITHKNYLDYKKNLTDGQLALFEKFDTFEMPIYPSKRDVRYSDRVHREVKTNALSAEILPNGNGVEGAFYGTPFPIPKQGVELIWNHQGMPNYSNTNGVLDSVAVFADGSTSSQETREERRLMFFDDKLGREKYNAQPYGAQVMVTIEGPARKKGEIILVWEFRDVTEATRNAWQYLPGTRRVRRAPSIGYDFPNGPGGLRTVDDAILFNGAVDRFTWKMEPVREIYIPYNANELDNPKYKYKDFMPKNHIDPKVMRYELHRVWIVVAELRSDKRHIYSKRRLYLDEDSWGAVLSDNYDGQNTLWRSNMRTMVNLYDLPGMGPRVEIYHDLQKSAYVANYLSNQRKGPPIKVPEGWKKSYFTTAMVRKLGKR